MKLKYYLRGAGIGIIVTTLILSLAFWSKSFSTKSSKLTDEEIMERATELGMVMADDVSSTDEKTDDADSEDYSSEENLESQTDNTGDMENTVASEDVESEDDASDENKGDTVVSYTAFTISSGQSSDTVSENLYEAGFITSASDFNAYLIKLGLANRIQAGTFYIASDSTQDDIAAMLVMNQSTRKENGLTEGHQE